jgi:hypothetical protein
MVGSFLEFEIRSVARLVCDQRRGDRGPRAARPEWDPAPAQAVELVGVSLAVVLGLANHVVYSRLCRLLCEISGHRCSFGWFVQRSRYE